MSLFVTNNGKQINLLAVTSVAKNPDGSLVVSEGGKATTLSGQNAENFELATSEAARVKAQNQPDEG
jgi:hypothetical protein